MKLKEYILMSFRDLWRRKGRTILTSLGITIGTLLIVTMMGIVLGLKGFMNDAVNSGDNARAIEIQHYRNYTDEEYAEPDMDKFQEEYFKKLDNNLIDELKDTNKIDVIVAAINYYPNSLIFNNKEYKGQIRACGYNDNGNIYPDSEIEKVRYDEKDDTLKPLSNGEFLTTESGQALIGEKLLEKLDISISDILNKDLEISAISNGDSNGTKMTKKVKIVGIIDEHFNNAENIVLSAKDVAELKGYSTLQKDYFENKGYDSMYLYTKEIADVESVSSKLKDLDYYSVSAEDMANEIETSLGAMNKGFLILGIIVLIVAAIGIVNTMGMAVIERTKSIGVMKSVGASSSAIRVMFLIQSSLIGLIGGIFGIILGSGINKLIEIFAKSKITDSGIDLAITIGLPWYWVIIILVFAMLLALISGIYPARNAAKLDPVEALRR